MILLNILMDPTPRITNGYARTTAVRKNLEEKRILNHTSRHISGIDNSNAIIATSALSGDMTSNDMPKSIPALNHTHVSVGIALHDMML